MPYPTAQDFVTALNEGFRAAGKPEQTFSIDVGRKYDRVVATKYGSNSTYCFIDRDGNIYKAASWKAPAKGIRATLAQLTPEHVAAVVASGYATTGWLYR